MTVLKKIIKKLFGSRKTNSEPLEDYYPNPGIIKEFEIQKFIKNRSASDVQNWFNYYKSKGHYFYESIYYSVQNKIASADDDYYIDQIKGMDSNEVKELLKEEKKEGVYFSNKVYNLIMRRINEENNQKFLEIIEVSSPKKVLTWYLKENERDAFKFLDNDIELKAHEKIFNIMQSESLTKKDRNAFFEYVFYLTPPRIEEIMKNEIYSEIILEQIGNADEGIKGLYYRKLGESEELKGNFRSAIEFYFQALKNSSEKDSKGIEYQKLGECQLRFGETEEGIKNLNLAAEYQPSKRASIFKEVGEFYEEKKDLNTAINYFEKALMINPKIGVKRKLNTLKKTIESQ